MASLPKPKGKTAWILGGLIVLVVLWYLAKRGAGPTVIPGSAGGMSDSQTQAAAQGFSALASVAAAETAAAAQLEQVRAEAAAYLQGQSLQAGATEAAAGRYANAQKNAYIWGTIRDIGVAAINQGLFGGRSSSGSPGGGSGVAGGIGFPGGRL